MQGFSVVFFAVWAMVTNMGATLRLTVLPWTIVIATAFAALELSVGAGERVFQLVRPTQALALAGFSPIVIVTHFVLFMVGCWVGVSWHRHILLKEQANRLLPRRNSAAVHTYLPSAVKFTVLAAAMFLMINWLMIPLIPQLGLTGGGGKIASILVNAMLVSLVLRLGLVLPAAAIGKPMSMEQSWDATRGYSGPVFAIALVVVQLVDLTHLLQCSSVADCVLRLMGAWAGLVLTLGALTVLYGVRVQGRRMIV